MDYQELKNLVRRGESSSLEFKLKTNHPEKIIKGVVAFANTNGGIMLIGVGDDKKIPGLKYADEDEYLLVRATSIHNEPSTHTLNFYRRDTQRFSVPSGHNRGVEMLPLPISIRDFSGKPNLSRPALPARLL